MGNRKQDDYLNPDIFARQLLEEAKRFLEKAAESEVGHAPYLHASLLLAFASLEAHINNVASDFSERPELNVYEQSILQEKEVALEHGEVILKDRLRISRIEDRFELLCRKFSQRSVPKEEIWWTNFKRGLGLRNALTHPKAAITINVQDVRSSLAAVVDATDYLYMSVFERPFPGKGLALDSQLDF